MTHSELVVYLDQHAGHDVEVLPAAEYGDEWRTLSCRECEKQTTLVANLGVLSQSGWPGGAVWRPPGRKHVDPDVGVAERSDQIHMHGRDGRVAVYVCNRLVADLDPAGAATVAGWLIDVGRLAGSVGSFAAPGGGYEIAPRHEGGDGSGEATRGRGGGGASPAPEASSDAPSEGLTVVSRLEAVRFHAESDLLVVSCAQRLSADAKENIVATLKVLLPDCARVLVLDDGLSVGVLERTGGKGGGE